MATTARRGTDADRQRVSAPGTRLVRLDRDIPEAAALREAALGHELPPEQLRFTGLPMETLPAADADADRFPYAVVVAERPLSGAAEARAACAGFGVLDRVGHLGELVDVPGCAVLLRAYYVTPEWQGRGVGRASCSAPLLDRLVAEVAPDATEIVLCVNEGNHAAQRLYFAVGFTLTGRRLSGSAGTQLVMSRSLELGTHPAPRPRHERTENPQ